MSLPLKLRGDLKINKSLLLRITWVLRIAHCVNVRRQTRPGIQDAKSGRHSATAGSRLAAECGFSDLKLSQSDEKPYLAMQEVKAMQRS